MLQLLAVAPAVGAAGDAPPVTPALPVLESFSDCVGVCTHFASRQTPYVASFQQVLNLLNDLGIRHIRDDANYSVGADRFSEFYVRLRQIAGTGVRFSLICYDALNPYAYTPPQSVSRIFEWCDHAVDIFEGSNEPPLSRTPNRNPLVSADHQRDLYSAVKGSATLNGVRVASPSYVSASIALSADVSSMCDYGNIHPYPGMEHPETHGPGSLPNFIDAGKKAFSDRPIIASESGYHTALKTSDSHLPVSAEIKARYLPRLLLWHHINGIVRTYIYELVSSFKGSQTVKESQFGLVDFDLTPTPSFRSLQALLKLCGDGRKVEQEIYGFSPIDSERHHITFRRKNGSTMTAIWLGVSGWDPKRLVALPPTNRMIDISSSDATGKVMVHRFLDDGTVKSGMAIIRNGSLSIEISDQLTILEKT